MSTKHFQILTTYGIEGTAAKELDALISAQPRTKDDFVRLSAQIIEFIVKRHQDKPLYPTFIEHHVRELAIPLKDVEVRKAASALTTLANEKQKEARDKASGKKKSKAAKPALGSAKVATRCVHTSTVFQPSTEQMIAELILACTTKLWMTLVPTQTTSCSVAMYLNYISINDPKTSKFETILRWCTMASGNAPTRDHPV